VPQRAGELVRIGGSVVGAMSARYHAAVQWP